MVKKLHVEFDANKMVLKVSVSAFCQDFCHVFCSFQSLVANQIRLVQKLSDLYINDSKQKFLLLQRKEEAKRALQSNDTEISQHVETFTVLANLMGLAIGTHGANIVAARKIEGIDDIVIDEAHSESSHCTFKVCSLFMRCQFVFRSMQRARRPLNRPELSWISELRTSRSQETWLEKSSVNPERRFKRSWTRLELSVLRSLTQREMTAVQLISNSLARRNRSSRQSCLSNSICAI